VRERVQARRRSGLEAPGLPSFASGCREEWREYRERVPAMTRFPEPGRR